MSSSLVKMTAYPVWKGQKSSYYTQYESVRKKMLNSIHTIHQAEANELSKVLNAIVSDNVFTESEIGQKILNHLPSSVDESAQKGLGEINIDNKFKVKTSASSVAWAQYYAAKNAYEAALEKGMTSIQTEENVNKLKSNALKLQGALNKKQGDVFEVFLQEIIPFLSGKIENFGQVEVNNIINEFSKSLDSKGVIQTQGSQQESITFQFNEEDIKISSQGKVDISLPSPFLNSEQILGISAKNYGTLRNIHLLGGGSVLGLVSQWPTTQTAKNYFLNALTVYEAPTDVLVQGRMIFAIQSLIGRGDAELANMLIINTRNSKNPIRVLSTGALLQEMNSTNVDNIFNLKFKPQLQLFKSSEPRDKITFSNRIKSLTLDTTLNKKYLYYSYLNKLANK